MKKTKIRSSYLLQLDEEGNTAARELYKVQEYDEAGNLLKEAHYLDGELATETVNTYTNGLLVHTSETDHQEGIHVQREYFYDDKGRLIRIREPYDDGAYVDTLLEYDEQGRNTLRAMTDDEEEDMGRVDYRFDTATRTTIEEHYNYNGDVEKRITTVRDEWDNPTDVFTENIDGDYTGTVQVITTFAGKDQPVLIRELRNGRPVTEIENTYGENGKLEQQTVRDLSAGTEHIVLLSYDEQGRHVQSDQYMHDTLTHVDAHEFNEQGDLIRSTESRIIDEDHTITTIHGYEIEYW